MSLPVLAQHMASKGRNGDTMLVHMTPGEVHGLHALALAHGGQLTINPETGLPEANFLKKLLPMIAGFALGPAGFGLMSTLGAAATVGGVTALATGSLQKGLMAGLGAYGGSSLGAGLMGAGEGAIGAGALASEAGKEAVASKIMEQELTQEAARSAVAKEAVAGSGFLDKLVAGGKAVLAPGGLNTLSAGMPAGSFSPKTLALMAAAPVLADQMVPTTTGMPSTKPGDTGYIRPFIYDPSTFGQGPQGLQALPPVPANQITYPAPPPGGANGGLVAFADGGITLPSDIGTYTAEQKADLYNKYLAQGYADPAIRQAAGIQEDSAWKTLQNLAAQRGSPAVSGAERYALTTPGWQSTTGQTGIAGLNANIQNWFAQRPTTDYANIQQAAQQFGVDTEDIKRALQSGGGSQAMQFVTTAPTWQSRSGETGLAGLSSNINRWFAENPNATRAQVEDAMSTWGLNEADIRRATGKSLNEMFARKVPTGTITGGTVTGGGVVTTPTATTPTFQLPADQQTIRTPVGTITGGTVSGTVDTRKALDEYNRTAPTGRPVEVIEAGVRPGYTGVDRTYGGVDKLEPIKLAELGTAGSVTRGTETMQDVRNAVGNRYAYQPPEFTPSVTGASKSAYDYLMGKGEYPTMQTPPGGAPLWRPYVQAATGATDAFVPRTAAPTTGGASLGFKPPASNVSVTQATQRWRNTKTGEVYLAPTGGYTPPSSDWVSETDSASTDLTNSGVGVGGGPGIGGANGGRVYAQRLNVGGITALAGGGYNLGSYSDGGRLLRGPGDGVSDSIPATIGRGQPARLADGEFVIPARIVSEIGNGSTEAGARKLYAMMDRVQRARGKTTGKGKVAANTKAERFLPA